MRLATLQTASGVRVVGVDGSDEAPSFVDLNTVDPNLPGSLKEVLALSDGIARCQTAFQQGRDSGRTVTGKLLAPIPDPEKVICIGLNYRDHALETNSPIPSEPVCFGKYANAVIGPADQIRLPHAAHSVDYEAELVAVIGRTCTCVTREQAFNYVAGYCNGQDVSARDWQKGRPGGQWLLGKGPDTFAPIGPWIVTSDSVPDPHALSIQLRLNGETMQTGNTSDFIFGIDEVIAHVSQLITLRPGDLIFTGTPPGVGMGRTPQVWLKPGDTVEIEIDGLGVLSNTVTATE